MRVAIVGGGLGGLAAGFLKHANIDVTVYEQASELSDVGAGIVVPPNMVRPLRRVGLAERLPDFAVRLGAAWEFRRWQDGGVLFVQPMGEECERLYGGHCYVAHRADLRAMLRQALPDQVLRLDQRCVGVNQVKGRSRALVCQSRWPRDACNGGCGDRRGRHSFNNTVGYRRTGGAALLRPLRVSLLGPGGKRP